MFGAALEDVSLVMEEDLDLMIGVEVSVGDAERVHARCFECGQFCGSSPDPIILHQNSPAPGTGEG